MMKATNPRTDEAFAATIERAARQVLADIAHALSPRFRANASPLPFLLFLTLTLAGCDLSGTKEGDPPVETARVIVGSGGVFGRDNGTLTIYNPETESRRETNVNGFLNSLAFRDDGRLYVLVNFSTGGGVIRTYPVGTYDQPTGQIPFEHSPRAITFTGNGTAYVTVWGGFDADNNYKPYPGDVARVNLEQHAVADTVDVGRQPEGIVFAGGKVFAANVASGTLSVLDTSSGQATGTIPLDCAGPNEVFVDEEEEVIIICEGDAQHDSQVLFLDPTTETISTRLRLDVPIGSINFTQSAYYSAPAEALFAISSSTRQVVRIDTDTNAFTGTISVPENEALVGLSAVAYDAANERLYVARLPVGANPGTPDYGAGGTVVILDEEGTRVDSFLAGPSPAHIAILPRD